VERGDITLPSTLEGLGEGRTNSAALHHIGLERERTKTRPLPSTRLGEIIG